MALRFMSPIFWQLKEISFVPAVDAGCFTQLLSSGLLIIFDCITWSSLSFISIILSSTGLLHQMCKKCEKHCIPKQLSSASLLIYRIGLSPAQLRTEINEYPYRHDSKKDRNNLTCLLEPNDTPQLSFCFL